MHRVFHIAGWSYVALCAGLVVRGGRASPAALAVEPRATAPLIVEGGSDAVQWFRRVRPYCNAVEVTTVQRSSPAPATLEGAGYQAACFALAGKIDDARRRIDALPSADRWKAAGIVFEVGHPVADAGDDRSAGPIMELVIDYWPNNYMALYHAGIAEYMLGQQEDARRNLEEFLRLYAEQDGWRANAIEVLARLDDPSGRGRELRRPREPGR